MKKHPLNPGAGRRHGPERRRLALLLGQPSLARDIGVLPSGRRR